MNAHLTTLQQALACVTRARIQVESYQPAGVPQALFLNSFRPAALRGEQLALRLAQQYRLLGSAHTPRQE